MREEAEIVNIEHVRYGEPFKRVTKKGVGNKVYIRDSYDRSMKKYCCTDSDDFCHEIYLKKGTRVFVGFTY